MSQQQQINELLGRTDSNGAIMSSSRPPMPADAGSLPAGPPRRSIFTDVISRGQDTTGAAELNHDDMLQRALSQSLPPLQQAPAGPAAVQMRRQTTREVSGGASPPMDWSLKSSLRFSSTAPFQVAQRGLRAPAADYTLGMRVFSGASAGRQLSLQERYQVALTTWSHPQNMLEVAHVAALERMGEAGKAILLHRQEAWLEAFRSAYLQLRSGACDVFYVLSPPGARFAFSAMFRAAGVSGTSAPHAILSRSTQGIRSLISGAKYGLTFTAPYLEDSEAEAGRAPEIPKDLNPEDIDMIRHNPTPRDNKFDGRPRSMLVFSGAAEVAGVHDLLANEGPALWGAGCDVAPVVSPVAFEGATVSRLQPRLFQVRTGAGGAAGATEHRLEFEGVLPPWTVDRLRCCLEEGQAQACSSSGPLFSMACQTLEMTNVFNHTVPGQAGQQQEEASVSAAAGGPQSGWLSHEERDRWQGAREPAEGVGVLVASSHGSVVAIECLGTWLFHISSGPSWLTDER